MHKRGVGLDDIYCRLNAVNLFTAAKPKEMRGPYEKPDELDKIASEINSDLLHWLLAQTIGREAWHTTARNAANPIRILRT